MKTVDTLDKGLTWTDALPHVEILIIGAGPTGLGAAKRLDELHHTSWSIVDGNEKVGGLSSTESTPENFLFDVGGHVIFSHYEYFNDCLAEALPRTEDWQTHRRSAYIRFQGGWIPYPFQNNLAMLSKPAQEECFNGLIDAAITGGKDITKPRNFEDWNRRFLGSGINRMFMRPYGFKVWALSPDQMQCNWLGERVAVPDLKRIAASIIHGVTDEDWGPNKSFRFPSRDGTGGIWKAVADTLPEKNFRLGPSWAVSKVDPATKIVTFQNGYRQSYNQLISTTPLDDLARFVGVGDLAISCERLFHSSTHVVGIGLRGACPPTVAEKTWLYFPEDDCPFYRATIFSNYSPNNCPSQATEIKTIRSAVPSDSLRGKVSAGPYWSIIVEISESSEKPVNEQTVVSESIRGLVNTGILAPNDEIVSLYHRRFEHGYPTPNIARDEVLSHVLPKLEEMDIFSRGRFGSWKYEVSNQDHSFMIGVETVDRILLGSLEVTLSLPDFVNSRKNGEKRFKRAGKGSGCPR